MRFILFFFILRFFSLRFFKFASETHRTTLTYFVANRFSACQSIFEEACDFMKALDDLEPTSPTHMNANSFDLGSRPRQLSRRDLPTFDGALTQWETFCDRFRSLIHNDKLLSNADRLHYLCSCVKEEASKALSHLAMTDANFDVAWQIFVERYDNKRRLVNVYMHKLANLPQVSSENAYELHSLLDQVNSAMQALKNLGLPVEHWDAVFVYHTTQRLDKASRQAWEMKLGNSSDPPSFADLYEFLESQVLESMLPSKSESSSEPFISKSHRPQVVRLHAIVTKKLECLICKSKHAIYA